MGLDATAMDLLRRVVRLEGEHGDENGYVLKRLLREGPGLAHDEYVEAAAKLFEGGLVERGTSDDYATLRARRRGRRLILGLPTDEQPGGGEPRPATEGAHEGAQHLSWWRRLRGPE